MSSVRTPTPGRSRVAAAAVALALTAAAWGEASASALGRNGPPPRYSGSEQVPTGEHPGPSKSGFAGDRVNAPTIAAQSRSFGQVAARAGVGLRTHKYSELYGNASTLDVYTPRQFRGRHGQNVRTVILVHGGAWQMGDRIDLESRAVQLVKQLGVVAVSVNYRLATEAAWPAQRDDLNAAVSYVRKNAEQLNVDTKRLVLLGSSAGGQIAATVATYGSGKKRFRGLITLSGLLDPLLMTRKDPSYSNAVIPELLLRCLPAECPERYESATALTQLDSRDPPSLLFHSRLEIPWDPSQAREFARASRGLGVSAQVVVLPGQLHGIDAWAEDWPTLRAWLRERLGTKDRLAR
ncbi:MAG TPA: alpha/beta hydrolase [Sporichthya sp.]|nr:alpha/beta hydrolase [Sporichthya sp.]